MEEVMIDRERLIKERAYSLWESEGKPDRRHEDHWAQAEREMDGANADSTLATDFPNSFLMGAEKTIFLPDQSADQAGDALLRELVPPKVYAVP
jgi:hypothetical protein